MDIKIKDVIRLVLTLLCFFLLGNLIMTSISVLLDVNFKLLSYTKITIIDMLLSMIETVIVVLLYRKLLKEDVKKIKKDYRKPCFRRFLEDVFVCFIIFMAIKIMSAYISAFIGVILGLQDMSVNNQNIIELLAGSAPAIMLFTTVVLAPILEELVFRGAIRKVIKNKRVFIAVSGLIFGLMHVIGSETFLFEIVLIGVVLSMIYESNKNNKDKLKLSIMAVAIIMIIFMGIYYWQFGSLIKPMMSLQPKELVGGISYVIVGFYLAYLYVAKDNIYLNIGVHALNNLFSMVLVLFLP